MTHLIDRFMEHLVVERGLLDNTRAAYRSDLAQFAGYLADRGVAQINAVTRDHVTEFLLQRKRNRVSARSLARQLAALRVFCRFLVRDKLLVVDPTQRIDSPKLWRSLPGALCYEEVTALLSAPKTDTRLGLRDKTMLELMYASGLRVSEVCRLKMADINIEGGFLRTTGQGNKERLVPVGKTALEWIERYLAGTRGSFGPGATAHGELILSTRVKPISRFVYEGSPAFVDDPFFRRIARGREHLHRDLTAAAFAEAADRGFTAARVVPVAGTSRLVHVLLKR